MYYVYYLTEEDMKNGTPALWTDSDGREIEQPTRDVEDRIAWRDPEEYDQDSKYSYFQFGWEETSETHVYPVTTPGRRCCVSPVGAWSVPSALTIELGEYQKANTMRKQAQITRVNIYRRAGEWCYRADDADGYDHSDVLNVADDATEAEARAQAREDFPHAEIFRVADG